MYLGRFRRGDSIPVAILRIGPYGGFKKPVRTPYAIIMRDRLMVQSVPLTLVDLHTNVGHFRTWIYLDSRYDPGHYNVVCYSRASNEQHNLAAFEVVEGGHSAGLVSAMKLWPRAEGEIMVALQQDGRWVAGMDPTTKEN